MASVKVTSRDTGLGALKARAAKIRARAITVGIHEDQGGGATDDSLTLIEVAEINEFGLGVPPRSFVRAFAEGYEDEHRASARRLCEAVTAGKVEADAGLEGLAAKYKAACQARIAGGIAPANAPSTIAKKGSSTPLIDTGQLRSAIDARVER